MAKPKPFSYQTFFLMRTVTSLQRLAGVSLLLFLGLSACTKKEAVAPATTACVAPATTACGELVTVRFCTGCTTPLTTLQLANGYYVLPIGATWQAYLAQQVDGQVLQVGYQLGPPLAPNQDGLRTATITCLKVAETSTK
jgi:hypothetical protein